MKYLQNTFFLHISVLILYSCNNSQLSKHTKNALLKIENKGLYNFKDSLTFYFEKSVTKNELFTLIKSKNPLHRAMGKLVYMRKYSRQLETWIHFLNDTDSIAILAGSCGFCGRYPDTITIRDFLLTYNGLHHLKGMTKKQKSYFTNYVINTFSPKSISYQFLRYNNGIEEIDDLDYTALRKMLIADVPIKWKEQIAELLYKSDEKENKDFVFQFIKEKNQDLKYWSFEHFFTDSIRENKELFLLFSNLGLKYPLYIYRLFYNFQTTYDLKRSFFTVDNAILKNNFVQLWNKELTNQIKSDLIPYLSNSTLPFYQSFYKSLDTIQIQKKAIYESLIDGFKNFVKQHKSWKRGSEIPPPPPPAPLPSVLNPKEKTLNKWFIDSLRKNKNDWKMYQQYLALK